MTFSLITGVVPEFSLGDRLRKAREIKGWEQQELAENLGIHRQTVAKYERGEGTPRKPIMMAWAFMTGVDLFWLRGEETPVSDEPWFIEGPAAYGVRPEGFEPPAYCSVADDYDEDWWTCPNCGNTYHFDYQPHHRCFEPRDLVLAA